jgi:hypothetical protein
MDKVEVTKRLTEITESVDYKTMHAVSEALEEFLQKTYENSCRKYGCRSYSFQAIVYDICSVLKADYNDIEKRIFGRPVTITVKELVEVFDALGFDLIITPKLRK